MQQHQHGQPQYPQHPHDPRYGQAGHPGYPGSHGPAGYQQHDPRYSPHPPGYPPRRPNTGMPKWLIIVLGTVAFALFGSCTVCSYVVDRAGSSFDDALLRGAEARAEEERKADEIKKACRDGVAKPLEALAAGDDAWDGRCVKVSGTAEHVDPEAASSEVVILPRDASEARLVCSTGTLNTDAPTHGQEVVVVGVAEGVFGNPITLGYCEWTGSLRGGGL